MLNCGRDVDKEQDDLKKIEKWVGKKKPEDSDEFNSLPDEIKLGVKYKVKSVPQIQWADCYGNELEKILGNKDFDSISLLREKAKREYELQEKRREDVTKEYKPLGEQFAKQKEKGNFSSSLTAGLKRVAKFDGYEPCEKAKQNLEEIKNIEESKK